MVEQFNQVAVYDFLEFSIFEIGPDRHFNGYLNDIVVAVSLRVGAFTEFRVILILTETIVPELMHCRKFKFLTIMYHVLILREYLHYSVRININCQ